MSEIPGERLPTRVKAGYALGDHAVNVQLAAMSLFYLYFLTDVAGLSPGLAGLVLLAGRAVDAFTDPAMGRISDRTRWRWGRRRPYFLIGALPFGITLALLFTRLPFDREWLLFAAYAGLYMVNTVFSTVLQVPYMALLSEIAVTYQERTSANVWRQLGVVAAVLGAAVSVRPLVEWFGGGADGWARMGFVLGAWVALPWLVVHRVSFERPGYQRASDIHFVEGMRHLAGHRTYRRLCGLFLAGRIAVDVSGAMLIYYFTWWLGRPGQFSLALGLMLAVVALSLPVWLRLSRFHEKRTLFCAGALWWIAVQAGLWAVDADTPAFAAVALIGLAGVGYGVTDLMPWSMLGDVTDEDELRSGERREGIYAGFFTFLRKLGGATGVALASAVLQLSGYEQRAAAQPESALTAIRALTVIAPAVFLAVAIAVARGYPLTRERFDRVQAELAGRQALARRDSAAPR